MTIDVAFNVGELICLTLLTLCWCSLHRQIRLLCLNLATNFCVFRKLKWQQPTTFSATRQHICTAARHPDVTHVFSWTAPCMGIHVVRMGFFGHADTWKQWLPSHWHWWFAADFHGPPIFKCHNQMVSTLLRSVAGIPRQTSSSTTTTRGGVWRCPQRAWEHSHAGWPYFILRPRDYFIANGYFGIILTVCCQLSLMSVAWRIT